MIQDKKNNNFVQFVGTMYPIHEVECFNTTREEWIRRVEFLIKNGCKSIRFNRAHNTENPETLIESIDIIKKLNKELETVCLVEFAIPNQASKRRIKHAENKEFKTSDTLEIYKFFIENKTYSEIGQQAIPVGSYVSIGDSRNQMTVIADDEQKVTVKWNVDYKIFGRPGIYFTDCKPESAGLDKFDLLNIKAAIDYGVEIISCSFVNNLDLAIEYHKAIEEAWKNRVDTKGEKPIVVYKIETSEPISHISEMSKYCDSFEISRGDLIQNTGLKSVVYQDKILSYCKNNTFPLRVYTDVGNYLEDGKLLNRNCMFAINSYIKQGGTVIGFSTETLFKNIEYLTNMFREFSELIDIIHISMKEKDDINPLEYNNESKQFLINNYFSKDRTVLFNNRSDYVKYCLFKGTKYIGLEF